VQQWVQKEEHRRKRNRDARRERLRVLRQFLCRDVGLGSQVSFAIEGGELVLAFKIMIVANWMVEGNAFKCVPRGWSSDGIIVVKNVIQAKSGQSSAGVSIRAVPHQKSKRGRGQ
jgi:hypothetical protein